MRRRENRQIAVLVVILITLSKQFRHNTLDTLIACLFITVLFYFKPAKKSARPTKEFNAFVAKDVARIADEPISCFACGLDHIDPEVDESGSYCDLSLYDDCPESSKMYNHTCDIMDEWGASDAWIRRCPKGVSSCFHMRAGLGDQAPIFRGCANSAYLDYPSGCRRVDEPIDPRLGSADITICYCPSERCNEFLSQSRGAKTATTSITLAILTSTRCLM